MRQIYEADGERLVPESIAEYQLMRSYLLSALARTPARAFGPDDTMPALAWSWSVAGLPEGTTPAASDGYLALALVEPVDGTDPMRLVDRGAIAGRGCVLLASGHLRAVWELDASDYGAAQSNMEGYGPILSAPLPGR